ncbi:MAG: MFS transporter [Bryobacterales bacterium]|nr:MFS transporter [Bryobacterales bacterium]
MTASPRYKWYLVGVLFCVGALNYGDRTAIASVFPLLRRDLGASDVELGAIGTLFLWAYALASPFAGSLADRVSRSRAIVLSLAAWSAVTLVTGFVTSIPQLLLTRVVLGFTEAAYLPAAIALIADYHASDTRASAISIHTAGLTVGLIAGGAGAGYLAEHFGWRIGFFVLGALGLVLAGFAHLCLRDRTPPAGDPAASLSAAPLGRSLLTLLSVPSYLIIVAEAMIVSVGTWIFLNWLPLYFRETYGMSLAAAGFAGTFMLQGAATLGLVSGGYLSDRVAGHQPRRRMLIQTVCFVISAPFLLVFLGRPGLVLLNVCIFLFSFCGRAGTTNETPLLCDLLPPRLRSTAIGLMNAANCFAGGIGVLLAGYLKSSFGLAGIFGGISAIMLAAALLTGTGYLFFLKRDLLRTRSWEPAAVKGAAI